MSKPLVFRRPTPGQGRALEVLGHAVEYLADSYSFRQSGDQGDLLAIAILHKASRDVFEECRVIAPLRERIGRSLSSKLRALLHSREKRRHALPVEVETPPVPGREDRTSGVHKVQMIF